jgi:endonuclease/exonuclease/phosphatase family metal-dependent hydrolase
MSKKRIFPILAALLLLATIMCASPQLELSILSFNIRYGTAGDGDNAWQNRKELVYTVIKDQNSDIVGLQEALKFQIDAILEQAPAYAKIGVGRDDGDSLGEYSAILYKKDKLEIVDSGTFWFSDTPDVIASTNWGNDITRICTWGLFKEMATQKLFYYYNLHLDHRSQPSREKSAQLLMQKIAHRKEKVPFFISGDFNAGEDNPAITYLVDVNNAKEHKITPLVDSYRLLHYSAQDVGTFGGFKGRTSGPKIDYIFVPQNTNVIKAEIIHSNENGRYPSDHYPVNAVVTF